VNGRKDSKKIRKRAKKSALPPIGIENICIKFCFSEEISKIQRDPRFCEIFKKAGIFLCKLYGNYKEGKISLTLKQLYGTI
jgi:hypothetical protein